MMMSMITTKKFTFFSGMRSDVYTYHALHHDPDEQINFTNLKTKRLSNFTNPETNKENLKTTPNQKAS